MGNECSVSCDCCNPPPAHQPGVNSQSSQQQVRPASATIHPTDPGLAKVLVPEGASSGSKLRVDWPTGPFEVIVPSGIFSQMTFDVRPPQAPQAVIGQPVEPAMVVQPVLPMAMAQPMAPMMPMPMAQPVAPTMPIAMAQPVMPMVHGSVCTTTQNPR
uniref:Uncharacterized protein n=1 Tax=Haptolina ericina TaxID=156174 RepID=A0A7S3FAK6_9EUKA|mmetsp:Transcript_58150/g.129626  ORF Transcript_58150/g.129626 Transcript_58150/m.129626 type:complete len:158 (+) Transcript_58150:54-527(+)